MKDLTGGKRGFYWSSRAWYHATAMPDPRVVGEVSFGIFDVDGGCFGEMQMRWIALDGRAVARLEAFEDSWATLASFPDVIVAMGKLDDTNPTEEEFVALLKGCDFEDLTDYESPYQPKTCPTCGQSVPAD